MRHVFKKITDRWVQREGYDVFDLSEKRFQCDTHVIKKIDFNDFDDEVTMQLNRSMFNTLN